MKFRVLGPLTVLGDSGPLALSGVKQRAVLGHLLLHANEVVATSTLVRALWPDGPPPTARKMLQNAVSALRGLFAAEASGAGPMLLTHAPGYLLRVDGADLDLTAYRILADRGRADLAAGAWDPAARTLRAALDLWHGPVLADLAETGTDWPELAALARARSATQEDLFEAQLACGRHHQVVPELETLVRREPLRERLCAQLMLGLYRCGRQADALEAYQATRNAFTGELGLEPGRTLRAMERAILGHDPVLVQPDALAIMAGEGGSRRASRPAETALPGSDASGAVTGGALSDPLPPVERPVAVDRGRRGRGAGGGPEAEADVLQGRPGAPRDAGPSAFPTTVGPEATARAGQRVAPPAAFPDRQPLPSAPHASAGGALTEQRRQLSMLLVRTALGKGLGGDPEDAARLSGELATAIRDEVERYGGKVSGVLGPVTFALFGVVRTREDDAARAVRAGLAIRNRLRRYGAGGPVPLRGGSAPRVAVATGDVIVTCAPDGTGAIPVVNGEVPRHCAALLETVPPGGIRVCATTRAGSERAVDYGPATGPDGASEPLGPRPASAATGTPPPLLGRDRELEQLRGLLGDVTRKQRPHLLTLLGEPGAGKTRLADELTRLARRSGFTVLTAHSSWCDGDQPLALPARILAAATRSGLADALSATTGGAPGGVSGAGGVVSAAVRGVGGGGAASAAVGACSGEGGPGGAGVAFAGLGASDALSAATGGGPGGVSAAAGGVGGGGAVSAAAGACSGGGQVGSAGFRAGDVPFAAAGAGPGGTSAGFAGCGTGEARFAARGAGAGGAGAASAGFGAAAPAALVGSGPDTPAASGHGDAPDVADAALARTVYGLFGTGERGNWLLTRLRALQRAEWPAPGEWPSLAAAWRLFLGGLAAERPLLLVLEDLHTAPDAVLDLVADLAGAAGPAPLLIAVTARPELLDRRPAWGGGRRDALTRTLDPLEEASSAALLDALLRAEGGADVPAELRHDLLERVGGNPLFATEYARELAAAPGPLSGPPPLPRHVRQVVAARLDALPQAAKAVLVNASVLGGVCCADGVAAVGDGDPEEAAHWLDYLERRDLLRRSWHGSPSGTPRYAFRHPATREVVDWLVPRRVHEDRRRRAAAWTSSTAAHLSA